jgi:asparagine synthase (glutamine-hydrolysing)
MCGIAGVWDLNGEEVSVGVLKRMTDCISHRGPDGEGHYAEGPVGLGHRRLAIIDLSTAGHQPMANERGDLVITYNGEIYNFQELRVELEALGYRFQSRTDTEVVIHAYDQWGESCVNRFNGMFAFAIFDRKNQRLFLARDRLGVKPLYYYADARKLVFASEIKSILEYPGVPRDLDNEALADFFSLNYIPPPGTPFKHIRQIDPGHFGVWQGGQLTTRQYWDIHFENGNGGSLSEAQLIPELLEKVKESVRKRLVADVPIGAFLSGGLDSSTVVHFMRQFATGTLKTFSVRFSEKSYDEGEYAWEMARHLETEHHEIFCGPADMAALLLKSSWHADSLTADISNIPILLVSRLAQEHVKVVLSGDGGDEVFAGYPTYQADHLARYYKRLPGWIRRGLVQPLVHALPTSGAKLSFDYKARKFVEGAALSPARAHYTWRTIFTSEEKHSLLTNEFAAAIKEHLPEVTWEQLFATYPNMSDMDKGFYSDYKTFLSGSILPKVDSMSMAVSLEAREPLLDFELVEMMARVPASMKMKGLTTKYLFKKTMSTVLPKSVVYRKKAGFHTPIATWFRNDLRSLVAEILSNENVSQTRMLNPSYVERLKTEHFDGRANHSYKLWGLMNFVVWFNHYGKPGA